MTKNEYKAERIEHYRARGEDYGTAIEWAGQDADAKYGR